MHMIEITGNAIHHASVGPTILAPLAVLGESCDAMKELIFALQKSTLSIRYSSSHSLQYQPEGGAPALPGRSRFGEVWAESGASRGLKWLGGRPSQCRKGVNPQERAGGEQKRRGLRNILRNVLRNDGSAARVTNEQLET